MLEPSFPGLHELASSRVSYLLRMAGAGGASRDRTDDLRVANATLSQLSYGPVESSWLTTDAWTRFDFGGSGRS